MATVEVLNWENIKVETTELNADVFDVPVRKDAIHTVVKWQLACRRQGTHKTKTKGEVRGGGKKPFKQKGTGNARQGSIRSPLMAGGGVIFGPTPRDYSYELPKKLKRLALRSALSYLYQNSRLTVVEDMTSAEGKTKELSARLTKLGTKKALLMDVQVDEKFKRASKNLPKFLYTPVIGLNVYDLLKYDHLIVTKASLEKIIERCGVN